MIRRDVRYLYYLAYRNRVKTIGRLTYLVVDPMIFPVILTWFANICWMLVLVAGGPGVGLPPWLSEGSVSFAGVSLTVVLALLWDRRRDRSILRMYEEFEPDGAALPINRVMLLRGIFLPVVVFFVLAASLFVVGKSRHLL